MEADHAGKMATAQAAIEKLTADISNQRAAHITLVRMLVLECHAYLD